MSDIRIKTAIPHPDTAKILNELYTHEPYAMQAHLPIIWDKAEGHTVTDIFGNRFVDFTSTIFVANTGHRSIEKDLATQAHKCIHSYTFPTKIRVEAIKKLSQFLPSFCDKIYLASAGSEVTSWAIKLMRAAKPGRKLVISLEGAFHGKTGAAGELEHEEVKLKWPEKESDIDDAIKLLESDVMGVPGESSGKVIDYCCGLMIESYKGWTASLLPEAYVQRLVTYCKHHGLVVCFDEIQAGFWRTGKKFAFEWYNVDPDMICLGKAIGGGFPVSALAGRAYLFQDVDGMSSTHSATPLACASIVSVLNSFDKMDMHEYHVKCMTLSTLLNVCYSMHDDIIEKINVKGMVAAIIFKDKDVANVVSLKLLERGLIVVNTGKESIKLGPPLVITLEALKEGLGLINTVLAEVKQCLK